MRTMIVIMVLAFSPVLVSAQPAEKAAPAIQPTTLPKEATPTDREEPPPTPAKRVEEAAPKAVAAPVPVPVAPAVTLKLPAGVTLIPHLQYRARALFLNNRTFADTPVVEGITHRARIGLDMRIATWWRLFVQVQDVRFWGEETDTLGDYSGNGIDFHQAFAEGTCPLGLMIRVGRQEISLDNERLVGAVDWTDQGRSFDGIRLGYQRDAFAAHAFWAKVMEGDLIDSGTGEAFPARDLAGLWLRYTGLAFARPSLLFLFDRDSSVSRDRFTAGLYLDGTLMPGLSYSAEFYYQGGSFNAALGDLTISALLAAVRLGYTAPVWGKPRFEAFFDYLSGDDDPTDNKIQSFDTLFATNHKFYGFMDYFLNVPAATGTLGLMDVGGRAKLVPTKWFSVFLDFHHFAHTEDGPDIGQELDLIANFKINRFAAIQAGFGVFLPAEDQGEKAATFGYLMANLAL